MSSNQLENITQYPGKYRHDFLVELVEKDGRSGRQIAKAAGISHINFYEVCKGNGIKIETLWQIVQALKPKFPGIEDQWRSFFDFGLDSKKFLRSVRRGGVVAER